MELVSRWGSPLTSEAPHSLAYPSPVNRRGHTTDLSLPAKSRIPPPNPPSWPPSYSFTLSAFLPGCREAKLKLCSCDDWATPVTLPKEERALTSLQLGVSYHLRFSLLCVHSAAQSAWCLYSWTQFGSRLATEPEAWHLNCSGNIAAHCRVASINHRAFLGADAADTNLAGSQKSWVKIPQVHHHFLSSVAAGELEM